MPRKRRPRHFEVRFGVSQRMLSEEAKYVGYELDDYLILSANDLTEKLKGLRARWTTTAASLEAVIGELPERPNLALKYLLLRDCWYVLELYAEYLKGIPAEHTTGAKPNPDERVVPVVPEPFPESLFPR